MGEGGPRGGEVGMAKLRWLGWEGVLGWVGGDFATCSGDGTEGAVGAFERYTDG